MGGSSSSRGSAVSHAQANFSISASAFGMPGSVTHPSRNTTVPLVSSFSLALSLLSSVVSRSAHTWRSRRHGAMAAISSAVLSRRARISSSSRSMRAIFSAAGPDMSLKVTVEKDQGRTVSVTVSLSTR